MKWKRAALFCFLLFLCRAPLLTGLANAWVVDEPVAKADAIVVPGGKVELRPFEAARLYHEGIAPLIVYMDVRLDPAAQRGLIPSEREVTRRILLSNNVPETAMVAIGTNVASTYDESLAVRAWVEKTGANSILIATDLSHTRRARWIFRKELRSTGAQVHVTALKPREYSVNDWWKHEEGLIAFQNEALKSIYHWFKY